MNFPTNLRQLQNCLHKTMYAAEDFAEHRLSKLLQSEADMPQKHSEVFSLICLIRVNIYCCFLVVSLNISTKILYFILKYNFFQPFGTRYKKGARVLQLNPLTYKVNTIDYILSGRVIPSIDIAFERTLAIVSTNTSLYWRRCAFSSRRIGVS